MAPVIALSTWTTRACSRSMLVSELSACDADRIPSRSTVPAGDGGTALGKIAGLLAGDGGRVGRWLDRVGPVQLGDLGGRAPGQVLLARFGDQVMAGVVQAVGEVEPGRVLGDQGPVPRPLALSGLVPGGVEGQGGGAEIAGRPRPLGLQQPQQVQEVAGRVRGAGGQPPGQLVQFRQQGAARFRVRVAGLPGQGQRAQQAGDGGRVEAREHRN